MSAPRRLPGQFDTAIVEALRIVQEIGEVLFFWCDSDRGDYLLGTAEQGPASGYAFIAPGSTLPEVRRRYLDLHYNGAEGLPKWFAEGVEVRVKATPEMRRIGLTTATGDRGLQDAVAWPKEVGTVARREGNGWWCWTIIFSRGRHVVRIDAEVVKSLARVKAPKATSEQETT